ncbi:hypothetical protein SOVF_004690 [Spinacia oleracea]|nr:hypothetical protein SOVF_004690 [Spinacia oleracea]
MPHHCYACNRTFKRKQGEDHNESNYHRHSKFVCELFCGLTAFKEAIPEDPYLVFANWNGLDATPCQWSDHVVKWNILGSSLKGFIAPELGLLTNLQELILHGNHLIGIILKEIGLLNNITAMDLGAKQFSGSIPHEIGNLSSIKKMNLQSNVLTGMLPHELGNSKSLQELHLDRNKLQVNVIGLANANSESNMHGMFASNGNVIGLCSLPQLMVVDLSYNFFGGIVPKCLLHLPSANFHGNCLDEKSSKQRSDAQCVMFADGEGCQLSWTRRMKIIIGIARGLRDLHTELNPPFTISELNSSAVYLTEDFSPKAWEYLEVPEVMPYVVEKEVKHFEYEDLKAVCEAASLCLNPD